MMFKNAVVQIECDVSLFFPNQFKKQSGFCKNKKKNIQSESHSLQKWKLK